MEEINERQYINIKLSVLPVYTLDQGRMSLASEWGSAYEWSTLISNMEDLILYIPCVEFCDRLVDKEPRVICLVGCQMAHLKESVLIHDSAFVATFMMDSDV